MAQKSQEPRSQTHAERRAEQRAKAQARAEQQAKERKQQTVIGVIVIAVVVALLAVAGVAVYRSLHPQASGGESSGTDLTVEQAHEQLNKHLAVLREGHHIAVHRLVIIPPEPSPVLQMLQAD